MKKLITLGLVALTLSVNTTDAMHKKPSASINAYGYDFNFGPAKKHVAHKPVVKKGLSTSAKLAIAATTVVAAIAAVYGADYALEYAAKHGISTKYLTISADAFKNSHYTFGTFKKLADQYGEQFGAAALVQAKNLREVAKDGYTRLATYLNNMFTTQVASINPVQECQQLCPITGHTGIHSKDIDATCSTACLTHTPIIKPLDYSPAK